MAINYTKVNWANGTYVNPTNMNTMDNGIKAACDGVDAINTGGVMKLEKYGLQTIYNTASTVSLAIKGAGSSARINFVNATDTFLGQIGADANNKPVFRASASGADKEIALVENVVKLSNAGTQIITSTSGDAVLGIKGSSNNRAMLACQLNNNTIAGYLGANSNKKPIFYDPATNDESEVPLRQRQWIAGGTTSVSVNNLSFGRSYMGGVCLLSVFILTGANAHSSAIYMVSWYGTGTTTKELIAGSDIIGTVTGNNNTLSFTLAYNTYGASVDVIPLASN